METLNKIELTVADLMSKELITVKEMDSLQSLEEIFNREIIHHLPVVNDGRLVGMISQGDLLIMKDWRNFLNLKDGEINDREILRSHFARDIMATNLITVTKETTLKEVALLMREHRINAFPVLENGLLVGLITSFDLIQAMFID